MFVSLHFLQSLQDLSLRYFVPMNIVGCSFFESVRRVPRLDERFIKRVESFSYLAREEESPVEEEIFPPSVVVKHGGLWTR